MAKKSIKKAVKKPVKKAVAKKAAKKTTKKPMKKAAAVAAAVSARPRAIAKADGTLELDFQGLHEKLDGYRDALKEILAVRESTKVRKMLEKIDTLQDDVNCQSTMVVGF